MSPTLAKTLVTHCFKACCECEQTDNSTQRSVVSYLYFLKLIYSHTHTLTWSSIVGSGQIEGTCRGSVPSKELTEYIMLQLLDLPSNCSIPEADCSSQRQIGLLKMFLVSPPDIGKTSRCWNPWYDDPSNWLEHPEHLESALHE